MTTTKQIYDLISVYLKTKGLDTFASAFAELFYDIEETGDLDAIQLAYNVEASLASATAGVCSEAALYESLKALSPSLSVTFHLPVVESQTVDSLTEWTAEAETVTFGAFDIAPAVGFALAAIHPTTHQTNTDPHLLQQTSRV